VLDGACVLWLHVFAFWSVSSCDTSIISFNIAYIKQAQHIAARSTLQQIIKVFNIDILPQQTNSLKYNQVHESANSSISKQSLHHYNQVNESLNFNVLAHSLHQHYWTCNQIQTTLNCKGAFSVETDTQVLNW